VYTTETKTFSICNTTAGILKYTLKRAENSPFEISHDSGVLQIKEKVDINIYYSPNEADVSISTLILNLNGEEEKILKLSAIAKYPQLSVSDSNLDFEELLVGKTETKEILIYNTGVVPTYFRIEKEESEQDDTAFTVGTKKGQIPPGESFAVSFKFQPNLVNVPSNAHYTIKAKGEIKISISCYGVGIGYDVHLSAKSMNFGEVSLGNSLNRLVNVVNNSDLEASFQFLVDQKNLFSFSISEGVVPARSSVRVIITYTPLDTINYYERVFCLIRNHKLLYMDLIGTCYDDNIKPLPLMQRHVEVFRYKVIMGIHYKAKKNLDDDEDDKFSEGMDMGTFDEETKLNLEVPIDDPNHVLHKEMFLENDSTFRDVAIMQQFVDFAFCEYGKSSEAQKIVIENKLPFKIELRWVTPDVLNSQGEVVKNCFKVEDQHTVIDAKSSGTFNIKFKPFEPDYYFFQVLQCFVYLCNGNEHKMRKFEDNQKLSLQTLARRQMLGSTKKSKFEESLNEEMDPPLCLNLRVIGHSFNPGSQPFIPMVKFLPNKNVAFPPCCPGESVYQTIKIKNTSDTPVFFKLIPDPSKVFRIFPLIGLIQEKSFALVCFEFSPKSPNHWSFTTQCVLNYTVSNAQNIHLSGKCFKPEISIANKGKLYFPQ
jgi:hypothetical protein